VFGWRRLIDLWKHFVVNGQKLSSSDGHWELVGRYPMVTWGHRLSAVHGMLRIVEVYMARVYDREPAMFSCASRYGVFKPVWEVLDGDHRVNPVMKSIAQSRILNEDSLLLVAKKGYYDLDTAEGLLLATVHVFMVAF
jgi:hypothetical protein